MTDEDRATGLRNTLVDGLVRDQFVRSAAVEAALRAVPRHHFAPWLSLEDAYSNAAWTIPESAPEAPATISQPAAVGVMLESFDLRPGQKVLEIGAGTGYNAALMAHLVGSEGQIVSIDIEAYLVEAAAARLADLSNVQVVHGDGGAGFAPHAPYDRIVATVGAWDLPPAWRQQLKPTGRLVLPLHLFGEPQEHILVSFQHDGPVLVGQGLCSLGMVLMRGEFARLETPVQAQLHGEWRGREMAPEKLRVRAYSKELSYQPLYQPQPHELVIDKPQARLIVTSTSSA